MLFRAKTNAAVPIAVFDVSSSSVAGAHALAPRTGREPVTMLASARIDAALQEELDMRRFVSSTVQNLEAVLKRLREADVHRPAHAQLVLASPWYVSQTRTVVYRRDDEFTCTKRLLHEVVDEEIRHVVESELEKFGGFGKEGTVVEKQISLVKLNGYVTADPFGKRARTMEIFLTITVSPRRVLEQFTDAIRRAYGPVPVHVTTSPYATFVAARDYFDAAHDCVIVDVGEEVTDVAFVTDGLFLYQHSFPVGSYGLYRALMGRGSHTAAEAEALVEAYRLGKAGAAAKAKIDKAVAAFSEEWRRGLQGILNEGHYGFCLPPLTYVTADPRFAGVYPAIISTDPFIKHACTKGEVRAVFISDAELAPHAHTLDEVLDVPLSTAALYTARTI